MRSIILAARGLVAAAAVTTVGAGTVVLGAAAPSPAAQTGPTSAVETHLEKGIVLECTGEARGLSAYVNLYENDVFTNYVQVVLDDNPRLAASREPKNIWSDGVVRSSVTIKGKKATIVGSASKTGKRTPVHEEIDDAGNLVVSDGWHRRLENDLVLAYAGKTVELTCDPAFFYKLEVTKTPVV